MESEEGYAVIDLTVGTKLIFPDGKELVIDVDSLAISKEDLDKLKVSLGAS